MQRLGLTALNPRVPRSRIALEITLAVWSILRAATEVLCESERPLCGPGKWETILGKRRRWDIRKWDQ